MNDATARTSAPSNRRITLGPPRTSPSCRPGTAGSREVLVGVVMVVMHASSARRLLRSVIEQTRIAQAIFEAAQGDLGLVGGQTDGQNHPAIFELFTPQHFALFIKPGLALSVSRIEHRFIDIQIAAELLLDELP